MPEAQTPPAQDAPLANGVVSLEARLRHLFAEQARLRSLLEQTRAQLDRVNRQVLQVQEEYGIDAARQEEYRLCVQRLLGFDPTVSPEDIAEALARGQDMSSFLDTLPMEVERSTSYVRA